MKHGKGTDLPGMTNLQGAHIGMIYVAPDDDRKVVLIAILAEERLKREQIVLVLPQQNKAFQSPEDFDDLKLLRRKLQAELIFVTPPGPGPADFARQRRFAVFSSIESFVRSFKTSLGQPTPTEPSKGDKKGGLFGGRNKVAPGAAGVAAGKVVGQVETPRRAAQTGRRQGSDVSEQRTRPVPQKSAEPFTPLPPQTPRLQTEDQDPDTLGELPESIKPRAAVSEHDDQNKPGIHNAEPGIIQIGPSVPDVVQPTLSTVQRTGSGPNIDNDDEALPPMPGQSIPSTLPNTPTAMGGGIAAKTRPSNEQTIYISPDDDLTTVREHLEQIPSRKITLVIPSQTQLRSHVAWKILYACARELSKEVLIVCSDPQVRSVAHGVKFRVAHSFETTSNPGQTNKPNEPRSRRMKLPERSERNEMDEEPASLIFLDHTNPSDRASITASIDSVKKAVQSVEAVTAESAEAFSPLTTGQNSTDNSSQLDFPDQPDLSAYQFPPPLPLSRTFDDDAPIYMKDKHDALLPISPIDKSIKTEEQNRQGIKPNQPTLQEPDQPDNNDIVGLPKKYHIFFCYAHEDEQLLDRLKVYLKGLQREQLISTWYDRNIGAGTEWEREIDKHLNTADVILLLVSPDFIASDYCYSVEVKRAMERHEHGEARVIPVILRPVNWQKTPFGKLQALPKDAKPIMRSNGTSLNEAMLHIWLDEAFFEVAEGIRHAIEELESSR